MLVHDRFILPGEGAVLDGDERELPSPPRPKSRNDLKDARIARYGPRKGSEETRRGVLRDPREIKDELDFADWYGEFEDDLQEADNKYRYMSPLLQLSLSYEYLATS